ncbi:hypothetical protein G7Z17_g6627 [Cylindrodendrum hubeiense]|uniref:DNA/RNA-binding domain-containing protein n=1 Tax=Cylindrodendrum hubeiense TaxID=595255 RepID=A0A9P5L828_9HYPO|nr:hypothetical protein G7Z17_g6627 [Cylindrodendrum hubeiense]
MDFTKKWVTHLRNNHRQEASSPHTFCPLCKFEFPYDNENLFRNHVLEDREKHAVWATDENINTAYKTITAKAQQEPQTIDRPTRKRRVSGALDDTGDAGQETPGSSPDPGDGEGRFFKKRSPSVEHQRGSSPPPASSIRSRARVADPSNNFDRGPKNPSGRQLWTEGEGSKNPQGRFVTATVSSAARQPTSNKTNRPPPPSSQPNEAEPIIQMMLQPETRPISQDQLVAEVKGIYAGLVMVETKCIEVDNAQSSNTDANKLNNEQWQALIALHRTLLHEHHDFFLASQHPSASVPLRGLASKYAMPARMWRHGIHSFLELLRHRLPASLEHMLTFLYLAYSMMALLYETVPAFEDTWIECLGDLGRYRMAIEDDDIKDREVWTGGQYFWTLYESLLTPSRYFMGIATGCSLLGYGTESNVLMRAISQRPDETDVAMDGSSILEVPPSESFIKALELAVKAYEIVVRRWGDTNTLPFIHTILVFIYKMTQYPAAMSYLERAFPWKLTMVTLNYHLASCDFEPRIDGDFPGPEKDEAPRPLPEDYAMRGLIHAEDYYPKKWFINEKIDEDEKYFELASMVDQRKERILYLGYKIAVQGKWLGFDTATRQFSVPAKYDVQLHNVAQSSETPELKKEEVDSELKINTQSSAQTSEPKLSP